MSSGIPRIRSWQLAAGPPLIVLAVAGLRLLGGPEPQHGPGQSRAPETLRRSPPPAAAPRETTAPKPLQASGSADVRRSPQAGILPRWTEGPYEIWDLSPEEFTWAVAHAEEVFGPRLEEAPGGGVRLLDLDSGSYAGFCGLRPGDVILDINGSAVYKPEDLARVLRESVRTGSRGWRIQADRLGQELTFDLRSPGGP